MPGIFEELAFRGAMQDRLSTVVKPALILAVLFGVIHVSPLSLPILIILGVYLGFLRLWSRSLIPAIIVHAHN